MESFWVCWCFQIGNKFFRRKKIINTTDTIGLYSVFRCSGLINVETFDKLQVCRVFKKWAKNRCLYEDSMSTSVRKVKHISLYCCADIPQASGIWNISSEDFFQLLHKNPLLSLLMQSKHLAVTVWHQGFRKVLDACKSHFRH